MVHLKLLFKVFSLTMHRKQPCCGSVYNGPVRSGFILLFCELRLELNRVMNSRVDQNYGGFINIPPVGQMQSSTQGYGLSTGYNVQSNRSDFNVDITELSEHLSPCSSSE